jgi:RNA polymerase sigma factor (sigma-70 family)
VSPFKEKKEYNFDVVGQNPVITKEAMPKFFLADTLEEAEKLHTQFSSLLNALARNYADATGLPASDLFGEGLIGLGRAYRDWNPDRSENYQTYATFRIKDAMVEFIRDHSAVVRVPTNMKKASGTLNRLKVLCEQHGLDYRTVLEQGASAFDKKNSHLILKGGEALSTLKGYAGSKTRKEFLRYIEKLENLPEEVDFSDQTPPEIHVRSQQMLEAALLVDKLREYMDKEELTICEGIMADKSYEEIGEELGKSKAWVSGKLKKFKEKITKRLSS